MKGLDLSISTVVMFIVGIALLLILSVLVTGNIESLEDFAISNIDLPGGGELT